MQENQLPPRVGRDARVANERNGNRLPALGGERIVEEMFFYDPAQGVPHRKS